MIDDPLRGIYRPSKDVTCRNIDTFLHCLINHCYKNRLFQVSQGLGRVLRTAFLLCSNVQLPAAFAHILAIFSFDL